MSRASKIFWVVLVLSAALLSGCAADSAGKAAEDDPVSDDPVSTVSNEEAPEETPAEETEEAPQAAPISFEGTDLEGNTISADIFSQSKLTMINVWATYCGPCLKEMPLLGELAAEYDPEEFQIVGIISDVQEGKDQSEAELLVQETGADYPHLLLNESLYYALLTDVTVVPTTFFLDSEGMVLGYVLGAKDKTEWGQVIDALLEEL